jgi:hypothetical protein
MPVFLHLSNLIVQKESIKTLYKGGLAAFKKDMNFELSEYSQEDDELISFAGMNIDEFDLDIEKLNQEGLFFNQKIHYSKHFTIYARYIGFLWTVEWLKENSLYAWHVNSNKILIDKAIKMGSLTVAELEKIFINNRKINTIK